MSPRRLSIAAGALLMVGSLLLPAAHAADAEITVHGTQVRVAPLYYGGAADCDDYHEVPGFSPKVNASSGDEVPPAGDRSFKYVAERTYAVGPQIEYKRDQMLKLRDLTSLKVDVMSPDAAAVGVVAAMYETSPGVIWYGIAALPAVPIGQWRTIDATNVLLNWRKNADPVSITTTIKQFALDHGPGANDERKARVGILFGCNDADFFVDNLSIGIADNDSTWDLEGMRTRVEFRPIGGRDHVYTYLKPAYLEVSFKSPDSTATVLRQELVHKTCKVDHCATKPYVNKKATMKIRAWPYAGWQEWVLFDGGNGFEPSPFPDVIEWKAQPYIAPTVNLQHPKKGQTLVVGGKIAPCHQGRDVWFQRKINGHWKNVQKGRAEDCKTGERSPFSTFRIAIKLKTAGTWTWRIKLDSLDPWVTGYSREFRQKVAVPHHPDPTPPPNDPYIPPTYTPPPPADPIPHGRALPTGGAS
ncbi:hypothetical protein F0U44_04435 [Nocardioides humilatus]|uniref:Uncharacterized protein n=1 Tax=Nocardioides humilatus TaxID=2607660 RepID=A0A5B1LPG4_9ACTN|nr:hypothetical protein [Nocardioides humilatus]KAA1421539.1 hypothetical protein F0U44_04435 [Nocardioides humilatus]